jgi:hypothetical protein
MPNQFQEHVSLSLSKVADRFLLKFKHLSAQAERTILEMRVALQAVLIQPAHQ